MTPRTATGPAARRPAAPRAATEPSFDVELEVARAIGPDVLVVGIDEVGRGALAGPVTVGACAVRVLEGQVATALPEGVRDSKALTARRREALVAPIAVAAAATGIGWVPAHEIDRIGISAALTEAALRALEDLRTPEGDGVLPDAVIIDGSVDVLSGALRCRGLPPVPVTVRVKADRDCRSVAAASVLAKVARDARMTQLHASAPQYAWDSNKGYGAAVHRDAITEHGIHAEHRASWNLTGTPSAGVLWEIDPRRSIPAEQEGHR